MGTNTEVAHHGGDISSSCPRPRSVVVYDISYQFLFRFVASGSVHVVDYGLCFESVPELSRLV